MTRNGLKNERPSELLRLGRVPVQLHPTPSEDNFCNMFARKGGVRSHGEIAHDMDGDTSAGSRLAIRCYYLSAEIAELQVLEIKMEKISTVMKPL